MIKYQIFGLVLVSLAGSVLSKNEELNCNNYRLDKKFEDVSISNYNKFSKKIGELITEPVSNENLIYSPLSIYYLLSTVAYGAKKTTAEQLLNALNLPKISDIKQTCLAQQNFKKSLTNYKKEKYIALDIANAIVTTKNLKLSKFYEAFAKNTFLTEIISPEGSKLKLHDKVNQWVDKATNHKIKNIINGGDVENNNGLILLNAIYFNGNWLHPFDAQTVEENFNNINNVPEKVQMMIVSDVDLKYGVLFDDTVQFVVLPYKNEDYKMVVAWPTKYMNLRQFTKLGNQLSLYGYSKMVNEGANSRLTLTMPTFTVRSEIELGSILKTMKVTEIFDNPNLKAMITNNSAVKVTKILQKAYISVNQNGTEAAAITEAEVEPLMGNYADFLTVDRPFYFAIVSTQGSLFEGRIINPKKVDV